MSEIRRAAERDIPALLELLLQVNGVHHRGRPDLFRGQSVKYGAADLPGLLADEARPVFVYTDDAGTVQGYVFCVFQQKEHDPVLTDIKTLYIDDLCVRETARGQGIGKALYEYAVRFARASGCYNLTLNVWSCNPGAMRFYERCGLTPQKVGMETILTPENPAE